MSSQLNGRARLESHRVTPEGTQVSTAAAKPCQAVWGCESWVDDGLAVKYVDVVVVLLDVEPRERQRDALPRVVACRALPDAEQPAGFHIILVVSVIIGAVGGVTIRCEQLVAAPAAAVVIIASSTEAARVACPIGRLSVLAPCCHVADLITIFQVPATSVVVARRVADTVTEGVGEALVRTLTRR